MSTIIEMFSKNKMILIVVGVIIGGFVLYSYIAGDSSTSLIQANNEPASAEARAGERAILDTLFQLKAITLSGTIFTNVAFETLRDFRTEIVAEPIGRKNPFAPIPGMATSSTPARTINQTQGAPRSGIPRP